ncbi:hypothetical protein BJV78DRAFT_1210251 [Lactifluus subvellereus]|nr:hypothetical protein BJV78DRAFT_1210251 [Lactifluus subvellereus]
MASSQHSISNGLVPPPPDSQFKPQRRVPPPALPPPTPSTIDIPQPVYGNNYPHPRSPSPLRSGFKVDPHTGEVESEDGSDDDDGGGDDDPDVTWGQRSQSPNPSISKFASSFAQRVGSLVGGVGSAVPPSLPTDEELEREAERERDRSRREAERILTQEAEERRLMEEKVLAMLNTNHSSPKHVSPARSQSVPSYENPSPTPSQRDGGVSSWWSAAKNRLTPTKEPLTAAQQVIQETKDKEKREKKEAKKAEKDRKRTSDWPATSDNKYSNPALLSLATPPKPSPQYTSLSAPSSPTPGSQGLPSSLPPSLNPSPRRLLEGPTASPSRSTSRSPSREPPPLYAQFNDQGTLDVPGTLLIIARRFEKLEKWTVGHVRALEDRMGDVERWLVEKENDKDGEKGDVSRTSEPSVLEGSVNEMRDELLEVQGRIGELGREMARLVTAPAVLSTLPSRVSAQAVSTAPQTNSSFAIHAQTSSSITVHSHSLPPNTPQPTVSRVSSYSDLRRRDSVSPPFIPPSAIRAEQPRSRLPYPTGDYTSPSGSVVAQGSLSPPRSPPTASTSTSVSPAAFAAAATRSHPVSVAGLPAASPPPMISAPSGLPRTGGALVAPPQPPHPRSSSISPTPRKRYTVALGEPIMKPRMSSSPPPISVGDDTEEEDTVEHTIGRSAGRHATTAQQQQRRDTGQPHYSGQRRKNGFGFGFGTGGGDDTDTSADSVPPSPPRRTRAYTQMTGTGGTHTHSSTTAASASAASAGRTNPARMRAQSTDRTAVEDERDARHRLSWSSSTSAGFRDPLVVRREEVEARAKVAPRPPRVVAGKPRAPVGELVAYFDRS